MLRVFTAFSAVNLFCHLFTFDGPFDVDNTMCLDLVFRLSLLIRSGDLVICNRLVERSRLTGF